MLQDPENQTIEKTKIYSKKAIYGFSVFFSSIFGGILLMQNLKDIGKRKEAKEVLIVSIVITILTILISNSINAKSSGALLCNIIGGLLFSEFYFHKYLPKHEGYEKKKIWKPLVISIVITIPLLLAAIYSQ